MIEATSEYTSHRYPSVTRVQYLGWGAIMAGFVIFGDETELPEEGIWHLIDEAVIQNASFYHPKLTRIFIFDFSNRNTFKCFEVSALSEQALKTRRIFLPRHRLVNAANEIADRHYFKAESQSRFL